MSKIEKRDDETIIGPARDLVQSTAQGFRKELLLLVEEGTRELVIDLVNVKIIDSVGIGVLIAATNSLGKVGGKLRIVNGSEDLCKVFRMMRLDRHFEVQGV
jgi:anti-sigma B factor antagonist